jgi:hypothetical protein
MSLFEAINSCRTQVFCNFLNPKHFWLRKDIATLIFNLHRIFNKKHSSARFTALATGLLLGLTGLSAQAVPAALMARRAVG